LEFVSLQISCTLEALQEIRIKHRWQAIDQENEAIEKAKKKKKSLNLML
jgi:hypothetical protein